MKLNEKEKQFVKSFKNQFSEPIECLNKNASGIVVVAFILILILLW